MLLISGIAMGQSSYQKVDNNTFRAEKVQKTRPSTYQPTGKYYIDRDSVRYEIHTHTVSKGENAGKTFCYIQKVSKKTGKPYWKKIDVKPEELSK
jgi:hypothetical protein